jgi:hypothetical protein
VIPQLVLEGFKLSDIRITQVQFLAELTSTLSLLNQKEACLTPTAHTHLDVCLQLLSAGTLVDRSGADFDAAWAYIQSRLGNAFDDYVIIGPQKLGVGHGQLLNTLDEMLWLTVRAAVSHPTMTYYHMPEVHTNNNGCGISTKLSNSSAKALFFLWQDRPELMVAHLTKILESMHLGLNYLDDSFELLQVLSLDTGLHKQARSVLHEWFACSGSPLVWKLIVFLYRRLTGADLELKRQLYAPSVRHVVGALLYGSDLESVVKTLSKCHLTIRLELVDEVWQLLLDFPEWALSAGNSILKGETNAAAMSYAIWLGWPHSCERKQTTVKGFELGSDISLTVATWVNLWSTGID